MTCQRVKALERSLAIFYSTKVRNNSCSCIYTVFTYHMVYTPCVRIKWLLIVCQMKSRPAEQLQVCMNVDDVVVTSTCNIYGINGLLIRTLPTNTLINSFYRTDMHNWRWLCGPL